LKLVLVVNNQQRQPNPCRTHTILIASMKVTLNSLSKLAWLLSFLRHACSGGAPPSKSNCREPNRPAHQSRESREQQKREPKTSPPIEPGTHGMGSPAAARSDRRNPPPATTASGSGRCCRSPSPPAHFSPPNANQSLLVGAGLWPIGGAIQKIRWRDGLVTRGGSNSSVTDAAPIQTAGAHTHRA
jgi:hypothetical protein